MDKFFSTKLHTSNCNVCSTFLCYPKPVDKLLISVDNSVNNICGQKTYAIMYLGVGG
nr:MAG TPA_asm: hypothetical protein [Caudoviricetes sp.]